MLRKREAVSALLLFNPLVGHDVPVASRHVPDILGIHPDHPPDTLEGSGEQLGHMPAHHEHVLSSQVFHYVSLVGLITHDVECAKGKKKGAVKPPSLSTSKFQIGGLDLVLGLGELGIR